jgi:hypothetical protein
VLCKFHIAVGGRHADKQFIWRPCPECHEASKHHLLKFGFLLLVRFNLGFITEGRHATVLIIPSSWGSQWDVTYKPSSSFSGAVVGRKKTSARGVSHAHSFTLFLVLLYFIFACIVFIKNTKKLASLIVVTLLLLVHYVVP